MLAAGPATTGSRSQQLDGACCGPRAGSSQRPSPAPHPIWEPQREAVLGSRCEASGERSSALGQDAPAASRRSATPVCTPPSLSRSNGGHSPLPPRLVPQQRRRALVAAGGPILILSRWGSPRLVDPPTPIPSSPLTPSAAPSSHCVAAAPFAPRQRRPALAHPTATRPRSWCSGGSLPCVSTTGRFTPAHMRGRPGPRCGAHLCGQQGWERWLWWRRAFRGKARARLTSLVPFLLSPLTRQLLPSTVGRDRPAYDARGVAPNSTLPHRWSKITSLLPPPSLLRDAEEGNPPRRRHIERRCAVGARRDHNQRGPSARSRGPASWGPRGVAETLNKGVRGGGAMAKGEYQCGQR